MVKIKEPENSQGWGGCGAPGLGVGDFRRCCGHAHGVTKTKALRQILTKPNIFPAIKQFHSQAFAKEKWKHCHKKIGVSPNLGAIQISIKRVFPERLCYSGGDSLVAKEPACQCRRCRFDSGSERSPGEANGNHSSILACENPLDRGAWRASVNGVAQGQTEDLSGVMEAFYSLINVFITQMVVFDKTRIRMSWYVKNFTWIKKKFFKWMQFMGCFRLDLEKSAVIRQLEKLGHWMNAWWY